MNTSLRRTSALLPVLALALAACGSQTGSASDGGGSGAPDDGAYVVTTATVDGQDHPLVDGAQVVLTVDGGRISLTGGCNQMSGDADWSGDALTLGALASTEMACAEPLMQQDTWLSSVFSGTLEVDREGSGFVLTQGGTVMTFDRQEPVADASLVGTRWTLDSMGAGGDDGSVSSVPAGVTAWFQIDGDRIQLSPGCNSAGGNAVVDGSTLTVSRLVSTMMACEDARGDVEREIMDVFSQPLEVVVDGQSLTLTAPDGRFLGWRVTGDDPAPATPSLEGTTWRLSALGHTDGDSGSMASVPEKVEPTLTFQDGRLLVDTGCNRGSASVTVTGDTLELGPLMLTKMACRPPAAKVEAAVVAVLDTGGVTWSIRDDGLHLRSDVGDELVLEAR
ncbi:MAG: META domain-containing protein [Nocardioidaceae bacterium]